MIFSVLKRKTIFLLFIFLISLGTGMKILSPRDKLDLRLYYTVEEAQVFFNGLSSLEARHYFYAELLDLGFLGIYGILSYLLFRRLLPGKYAFFLFVPAALDLVETALIIGKLLDFTINFQVLSWASTLKWLSGVALILGLIFRYLRIRQINA